MVGLQVLEAAPATPVVIIADCPSPAHLPALLSSSAWEPFLYHSSFSEAADSKSSTHQKVNCIVHLAPQQVGAACVPYLSYIDLLLLECSHALHWRLHWLDAVQQVFTWVGAQTSSVCSCLPG